jgi:hypothetical protein
MGNPDHQVRDVKLYFSSTGFFLIRHGHEAGGEMLGSDRRATLRPRPGGGARSKAEPGLSIAVHVST